MPEVVTLLSYHIGPPQSVSHDLSLPLFFNRLASLETEPTPTDAQSGTDLESLVGGRVTKYVIHENSVHYTAAASGCNKHFVLEASMLLGYRGPFS